MATTKFPLGTVVMTHGVSALGIDADITSYLERHTSCDWGDLDAEDAKQNEFALTNKQRLMSVYSHSSEVTIWIITEWDRSVTTILLPEEY
jgi:hypothetical protein